MQTIEEVKPLAVAREVEAPKEYKAVAEQEIDCLQLIHAASDDATRYHLCGVWFDFERGEAYATDGHIMAWRPVAAVPGLGVRFLHRDDIKILLKLKVLGFEVDSFGVKAGPVRAAWTEAKTFNLEALRKFNAGSVGKIGFNPDLMVRLLKALGGKRGHGVRVEMGKDALSPMMVTVNTEGHAGLCMPMRI
jgi:hypothetical protein